MIEVVWTYDLLPGVDMQAYGQWAKKSVAQGLKVPGVVECRFHRNILLSPQVRITYVWRTLDDWAKYVMTTERQASVAELRNFATNIRMEIWGPSPLFPKPLSPGE